MKSRPTFPKNFLHLLPCNKEVSFGHHSQKMRNPSRQTDKFQLRFPACHLISGQISEAFGFDSLWLSVKFPTHMVTKTPPEVRFWRKVQKGGPDECWTWLGNKSYHGYGRFTPHPKRRDANGVKPTPKMAHRLAWQYTNGPIPDGLECCHRCDNRGCCNPAHLFLGTHLDNMRDCMGKGRLNTQRGSNAGPAKLNERQVVEIRSMYRPGVVSLNRLAKVFGVSQRAILFIVQRKSWKHLP